MTHKTAGALTRTSRVIRARPGDLYKAFLDRAALTDWLPPGEMTGEIYGFDARVGGGSRMSAFYSADEHTFRGKTSDKEDMVKVRFLELSAPSRIIEAVRFVTVDPTLFGEMTMSATFEEAAGGQK